MRIPEPAEVAACIQIIQHGKIDFAFSKPLINTTPNLTWLTLALVEYRKLQDWVGTLVEERLGGELKRIGARGYGGHPERSRGVVPGLPDWEFYFHGRGCMLTHRIDGRIIDVDFIDGKTETIDIFFFRVYLESLRTPLLSWKSIARKTPLSEACRAITKRMFEMDWITEDRIFRLSDVCYLLHSRLEPLLNLLNESYAQGNLSAASKAAWFLNDALMASELDPENKQLQQHAKWDIQNRVQEFWNSPKEEVDVYLLGLLERSFIESPLERFLMNETRARSVRAVYEIIRSWGTKDWNDRVHASIRRIGGKDACTLIAATQLLLPSRNKNYNATMTVMLDRVHDHYAGEAALLLYCADPERGLMKFQECLQSTIPMCRTKAAATLAIINTTASKSLLLSGLSDEICRVECCTAIMETNDSELRDEARALSGSWWPPQKPKENATFGERREWDSVPMVRWEIQSVREEYGHLLSSVDR